MGLIPDTAVPPFFYVESPTNVQPSRTKESAPLVGVTFNGTRRDVLIKDITDIHGTRVPSAADSAKVHRQAFIYVLSNGRATDRLEVGKIDGIRRQWGTFFERAVDRRARVETRLRPPS